ncbi:MAG: amidohydrolase [Pirellulaceae bacterium]|nr:amidohydrolase [Pirellulaceae bacterium]
MKNHMVSFAAVLVLVIGFVSVVSGETPQDWLDQNLPEVVEFYRELHANPELSFQEEKTAARLVEKWEQAGLEVTVKVGGHGVVGILPNGPGPTVMLRTDMDALPVREATGLVYASQVTVEGDQGSPVGVMHACGHDIHMANLTAVARYLSKNRDLWKGTLMLVGQPAEERGAGAAAMLDDGLFRRFSKPDYAVALHVDPHLAAGKVGYRSGFSLANVDSVDIKIHGRGGHGAYPHTTIDPIVQAAELVLSLQTIVSREVKPIEPAVVTVGSIHGGTKHNVIGDMCELQLTVRSYTDEVRTQIHDAIRRRTKAIAMAYNAPEPEVSISEGTPSLWNDPDLSRRLSRVFESVIGKENVSEAEPSMGGEDFSRYGKAGVPILMFRLGAVDGKRLERYRQIGQPSPSLHSPTFYPDAEQALATGFSVLSAAALELLQ